MIELSSSVEGRTEFPMRACLLRDHPSMAIRAILAMPAFGLYLLLFGGRSLYPVILLFIVGVAIIGLYRTVLSGIYLRNSYMEVIRLLLPSLKYPLAGIRIQKGCKNWVRISYARLRFFTSPGWVWTRREQRFAENVSSILSREHA